MEAVTLPPSHAVSLDVPKWSTCDISLLGSHDYANAYALGPDLKATFRGPGGVSKTLTGFWGGDRRFAIRFAPTLEGTWTYRTQSTDIELNDRRGEITCTAAKGRRHGFLRVDGNHRNSFAWEDGTRCFPIGQTYLDWMRAALVNDHWKTSIDSMSGFGFTKVRFGVYASYFPVEHNKYPDAQPYAGTSMAPQRDTLNLPYWQRLDELIQYMDSKGLIADLILTTPYTDNRQFGTDAENERFIKYVLSRYSAYTNVIWCVANEWVASPGHGGLHPQNYAQFDRLAALVSAEDPWRTATGACATFDPQLQQ